MGNDGTHPAGERIRRAIMNLATAGGLADRASNHTAFVVDRLGLSIVSGEYPERTMIPLDPDLEELFGVSRTVIREAKKTLIAKGLLVSKAKVGTRVCPATEWNMFDPDVLRWHTMQRRPDSFLADMFEMRLIVEPSAAALAAERADASGNAALSAHCDALEAAASRGEFALADLDFHRQILHLSGNRFLQSLGDLVQTALYSLLASETEDQQRGPSEMAEVVALHRAIVRAVENREPDAAKKAMEAVLQGARDELLRSRGMT
ncbi:FadR/GntR family transcriptional regulator [Thioclava atlantica]|uniref:GntR family transcriptional regulator n=1 Tax=Thioclava atlantica TaxID=1317124 RepID=A0A085TXK3_9RHOB|nr:FadR/GntR family transcriptional regulator [Thioclava atlantica]KFE35450.1 GntR family transcriptional regulator [Thioclava atlantica]